MTQSIKKVSIKGKSQGAKSTHIETEKAEFIIGREASPLEYLFGSLAGYINVIGNMVAKDQGITIQNLEMDIIGEIDTSKFIGENPEPKAIFQKITAEIFIQTKNNDPDLESWLDEVSERCPVADNLFNESNLNINIKN